MEDENSAEILYKQKIEEHQVAALKTHQLISSDSSSLRRMNEEEHIEVTHKQLPLLRNNEESKNFMKFDISRDYSDHHFRDEESNSNLFQVKSMKQ